METNLLNALPIELFSKVCDYVPDVTNLTLVDKTISKKARNVMSDQAQSAWRKFVSLPDSHIIKQEINKILKEKEVTNSSIPSADSTDPINKATEEDFKKLIEKLLTHVLFLGRDKLAYEEDMKKALLWKAVEYLGDVIDYRRTGKDEASVDPALVEAWSKIRPQLAKQSQTHIPMAEHLIIEWLSNEKNTGSITELDLSGIYLYRLPFELHKFSNLTKLNVSNCNLQYPEIVKMSLENELNREWVLLDLSFNEKLGFDIYKLGSEIGPEPLKRNLTLSEKFERNLNKKAEKCRQLFTKTLELGKETYKNLSSKIPLDIGGVAVIALGTLGASSCLLADNS